MHAQTNPLQRVYDCVRCACANSRTRHTKNAARGHIAFSHFGDAAAILSARGLVHKRWHASISQGSCICTSYTFKVYALAITLLRHAHAHMHALHNVHMRVPYGTESLPKTRASLMQHCMVAASRVDPWPKLVFSATTDCALHPYVSTTYRRPIPRTRKQGRVFARRRRKFWKLGSETVEF